MNADGTCIEDTYYFVNDREMLGDHNWTIIHSIVERKSDGLRHPHSVAYNTKTGNITDATNSRKDNPITLPFMVWIRLGNVGNIKQYTPSEFRTLLLKTKRWDFYHLTDLPKK
jgi:hypothetical protein